MSNKLNASDNKFTRLTYADGITRPGPYKPDLVKLRKLARKIRNSVEDYLDDSSVHPISTRKSD